MNRIIAILLAACYMAGSFGVTMSHHYCGGELKYISIKAEEKDTCCKGEMQKGGCCEDKTVSIKIDDHKQYALNTFTPLKIFNPGHFLQVISFFDIQINEATEVQKVSHSPPLLCSHLRLYILNCVYLI